MLQSRGATLHALTACPYCRACSSHPHIPHNLWMLNSFTTISAYAFEVNSFFLPGSSWEMSTWYNEWLCASSSWLATYTNVAVMAVRRWIPPINLDALALFALGTVVASLSIPVVLFMRITQSRDESEATLGCRVICFQAVCTGSAATVLLCHEYDRVQGIIQPRPIILGEKAAHCRNMTLYACQPLAPHCLICK